MTSISGNGATDTIYIQDTGSSTIQYRINNGSWSTISSWPATITNTNPGSTSVLKILFETNITLNGVSEYFVCGSSYLQFGSTSLNSDGTRVSVTIDSVSDYPGLIQNGIFPGNGNSYISIYNLNVSENGSTLAYDAGWIGQSSFGVGASNNFIVNCSSTGDIGLDGGGIVGLSAGTNAGASLIIRGCSSSGTIPGNAGGITGRSAGYDNGSVTCEGCWSEGNINGQDSGGIFGGYAGNNSGYALATKCYSTGPIASDGGGIFGGFAGESIGQAHAQNCYSRGSIGASAGGIFSRHAAELGGTTTATNCYSSGSISINGYGIYGVNQRAGATQSNCYAADNSWSDATANLNLTGDPVTSDVGTTWIKRGTNQPYELNGMGYTPYSTTVIDSSSQLIQSYSQTVNPGESTVGALSTDASGNEFSILQKSGGNEASYPTITMSSQTGSISTTAATAPGTYTITLRSIGSYNITTFILTISADALSETTTCCVTTIDERGLDYAQINNYRIGNRLLLEVSQNPKTTFDGYSQYVKYKMAQGSRKF